MLILRILGVIGGVLIVVLVLDAAVRTFVLPRGVPVMLTRMISLSLRRAFDLVARPIKSFEQRERIMAMYGPLTLLTYPIVWLAGVLCGFTLMYRCTVSHTWAEALRFSGSALFTLGFAIPTQTAELALVYAEATIGLGLLALLLAYLPTIYGTFSRRESVVGQLSVRAGTPPAAIGMLIRAHQTDFVSELDLLWQQWEVWFVEIEESHTSLAILNFFRSPNPKRSWLTAAGVVLDSAALRTSTLSEPYTPYAPICLRAGFLALRSIADYFSIPYDPDPPADGPISITREQYMGAYQRLADAGVPVKADSEQAWRDFAGWRVNYDAVLNGLGALIIAPYAEWISDGDGTLRSRRPPLKVHRQ